MVLCQRLAETISKALATNLIRLAVGGTSVALAAIKLGASQSAPGVFAMDVQSAEEVRLARRVGAGGGAAGPRGCEPAHQ